MKKIIFLALVGFFGTVGCSGADSSVKGVINSLQCNGVSPIHFDLSNNELIENYNGKETKSKYKILQDTDDIFVIQLEEYNKGLQNGPDEITYERRKDGKIYRTLKRDSAWNNASTQEPRECWKK